MENPYYSVWSRVEEATRALDCSFLAGSSTPWQAALALSATRRALKQQADRENIATVSLHKCLKWPPDDSEEPTFSAKDILELRDVSEQHNLPRTPHGQPTLRVHPVPCPKLLRSLTVHLGGANEMERVLREYILAAIDCTLRWLALVCGAPGQALPPQELRPLHMAITDFTSKARNQGRDSNRSVIHAGFISNHPDLLPIVLAALSSLGSVVRIRYHNQASKPSLVQLGRMTAEGGKYLYVTIQRQPQPSGSRSEPPTVQVPEQHTIFYDSGVEDAADLPPPQSKFLVRRLMPSLELLRVRGLDFLVPELVQASFRDYSHFEPAYLETPIGYPLASTQFVGPDSTVNRGSNQVYKLKLQDHEGAWWWQLQRREGPHFVDFGRRVLAEPRVQVLGMQQPQPQAASASGVGAHQGPMAANRGQPHRASTQAPQQHEPQPQPQPSHQGRSQAEASGHQHEEAASASGVGAHQGPMSANRGQPHRASTQAPQQHEPQPQPQPSHQGRSQAEASGHQHEEVEMRANDDLLEPEVQRALQISAEPLPIRHDGSIVWQNLGQNPAHHGPHRSQGHKRAGGSANQMEPDGSRGHKRARVAADQFEVPAVEEHQTPLMEVPAAEEDQTPLILDELLQHFETHEQLNELQLLRLAEGMPSSPGHVVHLLDSLKDLRGWLEQAKSFPRPSVADMTGMPGVGKSRIISEIIKMVVGFEVPAGEPLPDQFWAIPWEQCEMQQAGTTSDQEEPPIIYDDSIPLPHLDEVDKKDPWYNKEEQKKSGVGWLCSSQAGASVSAVPTFIEFHQEEDQNAVYVERHLRTLWSKDETMREADADAMQAEGEERERGSLSVQKARALLGLQGRASLPPRGNRRVPGALRHKILYNRFDRRDPQLRLKLNRLQFRNTCKGPWGHFYKAVIRLPGPKLPTLLDTPGVAGAYGLANLKEVVKGSMEKSFAIVLVINDRTSGFSGDTLAVLEALDVPKCMAQKTDISPVPVHVHIVCNIKSKEEDTDPMSKGDFFLDAHDEKAAYTQLVPDLISAAHPEEQKLMLEHHHAYPLFLLEGFMEKCIIEEDWRAMEEYKLPAFWDMLKEQWMKAGRENSIGINHEALLKLQQLFSQMYTNWIGSDLSNGTSADACKQYMHQSNLLHETIVKLADPLRQKVGAQFQESIKAVKERDSVKSLMAPCSTDAVKRRIDLNKKSGDRPGQRSDLFELCRKGNQNLRRAMKKKPSEGMLHVLVFGSEFLGPSIASVVVTAAQKDFLNSLDLLGKDFKDEVAQRFGPILRGLSGSAQARLADLVHLGLHVSLEAKFNEIRDKCEEGLQRLRNSDDQSHGDAYNSVLTKRMAQIASTRPDGKDNTTMLNAIAREAPVWGEKLVEWYTDRCIDLGYWTLDRWQEEYNQALLETELVLEGHLDKIRGSTTASPQQQNTGPDADGPHVQACKATMYSAAKLVCRLHDALTSSRKGSSCSSERERQGATSQGTLTDVASSSSAAAGALANVASTNALAAGDDILLAQARDVVRRRQESPEEYQLPSTQIDELVQAKREAMELPSQPEHGPPELPDLPSFVCGCCQQTHTMVDRKKIGSLNMYLERKKVRGSLTWTYLRNLCGGEGDLCRHCYERITRGRRDNPRKPFLDIWEDAKARRKKI
ncbi:hypothetical protein DUNSADRAFT_980 [Dunaliella salina]|uniref:Uncharacterized protein n=1 Tax=Dunaliella salina TaxID=3046 RepID=A0ABQ7FY70_DUNSA|nr:hypothetical protein DUNSADRAFT_980 [Dunaliella salina]|eukprot:KAF5827303.1 hypothetical protein DUNSADRAFT_980 [Dunaliella salina]